MHRFVPPAFWAAAILLAGCGPDASDDAVDRVAVRDSAGVAVITVPGPDTPLEPALQPLGDVIPTLAGTTVVPWGVAAGADDRVVVVDWTANRVAVRSLTGESHGSLGGSGEGPGEFRNPVAAAVDPDGIVTIWDAGRGILSRWAADGTLLEERRAPADYFGPGFAMLPGGAVAVVTAEGEGRGTGQRLEIVHGQERTTLHSVIQETPVARLPCGTFPMPRVFAPSLAWASGPDRIHVHRGPGYRIDAFVDGRVERSVRRDVPPLRPSPADAAAAARGGPGPHAGLLRRCGVTAEELVQAVGYEREVSPVMFVAVDRTGGLWVTRTLDGVRPGPVDVFDPDGRYRGTVTDLGIPAAFPDDSTVLTIRIGAQGGTGLSAWRWTPGS